MVSVIARESFRKIWYDPHTFDPNIILFNKGKSYDITKEGHDMVIINGCIFSKDINLGSDYIYDRFFTNREIRKQKLLKIDESKV